MRLPGRGLVVAVGTGAGRLGRTPGRTLGWWLLRAAGRWRTHGLGPACWIGHTLNRSPLCARGPDTSCRHRSRSPKSRTSISASTLWSPASMRRSQVHPWTEHRSRPGRHPGRAAGFRARRRPDPGEIRDGHAHVAWPRRSRPSLGAGSGDLVRLWGKRAGRALGPAIEGGDYPLLPTDFVDGFAGRPRENQPAAGGYDVRPDDHGRLDRAEPLADPARRARGVGDAAHP